MGLADLFTRNLQYSVTNTKTGQSEMFEVYGDNPLAPMWCAADGYRGALGLPGAWRAATLLSDLIGGLPWQAFETAASGTTQKVAPLPGLLGRPNPPEDRVSTFASLALDVLMNGNGVAPYTAFDRSGLPTAMVPVPSDQVVVRRKNGGIWYSIAGQDFPADQVFHVKGPHKPGALRGMGVLETHFDTIDLAAELNRQARSVSRNGVPTGKLTVKGSDVTDTEVRNVKANWLQAQRDRTVAAVTDSVDFQPLAWNPSETQLIDARKFSLQELALIFRVPGWFLGVATDGMTYSNIEGEALNLLKFSLAPWLTRFEQALSGAMAPGTWARANVDSLLRNDTLTRYKAHEVGIHAGFLLRSEARDLEDLPPVEGIDDQPLIAPNGITNDN
jgi:HK97 family phage portal protein